LLFRAVDAFAANITSVKLAIVLFEVVLVATLLALLRRRKLPETRILLYVWHPLPLFEFAGSGHVDAAALALMLLACLVAERRRPLIAGALLGAATLVKFFPLAVLPAIYRRWDWRLPFALVVAALALYLPFLGAHWHVLGFLPGYIHEEGLADGRGFFLLEALGSVVALPRWSDTLYLLCGAGLLGWMAWRAMERREPSAAMISGLGLIAVFTLLLSPHLAWYFTWIIPFLCFRLYWSLVYVSVVSPLLYRQFWEPSPLVLHATLYVPCAILFLAETLIARRGPMGTYRMSLSQHAD
jgi:alpha-1,6-mannosyltransferase